MKIPAFITVRTQSTRLPKKCLLPFGKGNVLEHIINRSKYYGLEPYICTTLESNDDIIEEIAKNHNVKFYRGSTINKLKRWLDCCEHYDINQFHTVDADDPFFDGDEVKRSIVLLNEGYDMVSPTSSSSSGDASVGYSLTKDIIARTCTLFEENSDTEIMWYYIEKVKGINKIALPDQDSNPIKIRLTLDYEEDYWLLSTVQRILSTQASRKEVNDLFRNNPDLYKVNWFRNIDWQEDQLAKKI